MRENSNCSSLQQIPQLVPNPPGPLLAAPKPTGHRAPPPSHSGQQSYATWARTSRVVAGARARGQHATRARGCRQPEHGRSSGTIDLDYGGWTKLGTVGRSSEAASGDRMELGAWATVSVEARGRGLRWWQILGAQARGRAAGAC
jgi:hypothetical protein